MNDPWLTLEKHEVQGDNSCIAWAIEYLAKVEGSMQLGEYSFQKNNPSGLGFGPEAQKLLDGLKGCKVKTQEFHFDWNDFEQASKADAARGRPLVFALPQCVYFTMKPPIEFGDLGKHAAVAIHDPCGAYVMRQRGNSNLMLAPIREIYEFVRLKLNADYRIHCLRDTA